MGSEAQGGAKGTSTKATSQHRRLEIFLLTWRYTIKWIGGGRGETQQEGLFRKYCPGYPLTHFRLFLPKTALKSKHILSPLFSIQL